MEKYKEREIQIFIERDVDERERLQKERLRWIRKRERLRWMRKREIFSERVREKERERNKGWKDGKE